MKTIVTLTMNPALDIATRVEKLIADHKLRCHSASQDPGGGGINVARALLRLGGQAIALYPCGGKTGERLQELLAQETVPQQLIPIAQPIREDFLVHENASGQDYRFVLPGPTLREAEWRHCLAQLAALATQADYIVASGSLPQGVPVDFYAQVARLAKAQETRLILDTSKALSLSDSLLALFGIIQQGRHGSTRFGMQDISMESYAIVGVMNHPTPHAVRSIFLICQGKTKLHKAILGEGNVRFDKNAV